MQQSYFYLLFSIPHVQDTCTCNDVCTWLMKKKNVGLSLRHWNANFWIWSSRAVHDIRNDLNGEHLLVVRGEVARMSQDRIQHVEGALHVCMNAEYI